VVGSWVEVARRTQLEHCSLEQCSSVVEVGSWEPSMIAAGKTGRCSFGPRMRRGRCKMGPSSLSSSVLVVECRLAESRLAVAIECSWELVGPSS
jgi:hypothetical protein